jgi:cytochrome d ubiquinol oxidase subunit I
MPYLIPLPFLAGVAGWITTEMGRQPWIVQGLLTTAQGISPNLTVADVMTSLVGFTLVYGALGVIMVRLMYKFARQGTEAALKQSVDVEEYPTSGELFPVGAQD